MSNKKIIIVCGSGTIGSEIAKEVKNDGFQPHLIGRNITSLKSVSQELNCPFNEVDINNTDKLKECLNNITDEVFGFAYCVGSINLKPIKSASENDFIESFKINTIGAIVSIQHLLENLKRNKGSILLFSTVAAKQGFINHSIVSTSKAAVEGLTLSLATELAPEIRVNCIAPGLTESGMSKGLISNDTIKKAIANMNPIPKLGQASDFGKISSFLLGENNKWITGQIIHIDGGRSTLRKKG